MLKTGIRALYEYETHLPSYTTPMKGTMAVLISEMEHHLFRFGSYISADRRDLCIPSHSPPATYKQLFMTQKPKKCRFLCICGARCHLFVRAL